MFLCFSGHFLLLLGKPSPAKAIVRTVPGEFASIAAAVAGANADDTIRVTADVLEGGEF